MSHETHCNQGEYEGSCKYGEASTCPMLKEPTPQEPDGSVPGGTATPAGCGPLEPVAYADKATYAYCIKEGKGFDVWPLIGELTNPDNVVRIYGPEAADTIAALQSLVGEDKLALGKQLAQSNAERQQLQEAVAALQAENAELRKNYNAGRTDELVKAMQIIATTPGSAAHHRIAHQALVRGDAPPFGAASLSTDGLATVYLDEIGNLVVVGYAAYRKTAYVDEGRAIPDSWRRLVVANADVTGLAPAQEKTK